MILGIGSDIIDIRRIEKTIARHGDRFLTRIFTETERAKAMRRTERIRAATFAKRFAQTYAETNKQFNAGQVEPLLKTYTPLPLRGTLLTMLAFCVGVLLIGCVNVMNMQFARASLRAVWMKLAYGTSLSARPWLHAT